MIIDHDKILKHVKAKPGRGAEEIKKTLKIAKNHWKRAIDKLLEEKKIRRRGQKRSAKYHPVKGK